MCEALCLSHGQRICMQNLKKDKKTIGYRLEAGYRLATASCQLSPRPRSPMLSHPLLVAVLAMSASVTTAAPTSDEHALEARIAKLDATVNEEVDLPIHLREFRDHLYVYIGCKISFPGSTTEAKVLIGKKKETVIYRHSITCSPLFKNLKNEMHKCHSYRRIQHCLYELLEGYAIFKAMWLMKLHPEAVRQELIEDLTMLDKTS